MQALETQNKTLAAQLRRLHQMVVSGGSRNGQTSTALMVLLLSTALFLIPGLSDQGETKPEIDIQVGSELVLCTNYIEIPNIALDLTVNE